MSSAVWLSRNWSFWWTLSYWISSYLYRRGRCCFVIFLLIAWSVLWKIAQCARLPQVQVFLCRFWDVLHLQETDRLAVLAAASIVRWVLRARSTNWPIWSCPFQKERRSLVSRLRVWSTGQWYWWFLLRLRKWHKEDAKVPAQRSRIVYSWEIRWHHWEWVDNYRK